MTGLIAQLSGFHSTISSLLFFVEVVNRFGSLFNDLDR